jgi:hypothetical protein
MPLHSTKERMSSWLEITPTMSTASRPERQRCSRSYRQWPNLETAITTRGRASLSCSSQCMSKRWAMGARPARSISRGGIRPS